MASHGVPRSSGAKPATEQARNKEAQKIQSYQTLVETVFAKIGKGDLSPDTLDLTSRLLLINPEYYTIWNHRRLIMRKLFSTKSINDNYQSSLIITEFISKDLDFLVPLLRKFPKCYWIWNYRLWLLKQSSELLSAAECRKFWQQELDLVGKMLNLDSRNFHGWGYRRVVVDALESDKASGEGVQKSMAREEYDYTTRMIESNLSNFSAWHSRSKLIPRLLKERAAGELERQCSLDAELDTIQRALYTDSNDQSLWFYHQYLMCTFDPRYAANSIAPDLSTEKRLEYLQNEHDKILDMLDGAEDCKWIYQSLIQLSKMRKSMSNEWPNSKETVFGWLAELRKLDPVRIGRWNDLERDLQAM